MPYSYINTLASGATNLFSAPPTIKRADLHAYVNGVEVAPLSFPSPGIVELPVTAASLAGKKVIIRRLSNAAALPAVFSVGSFDPVNLNLALRHLLYLNQEALDAAASLGDFLLFAPTSEAGLPPGSVWLDNNFVKVTP